MTRPALFITGAANGIGRATARRFAAAGWFCGCYDIDVAGAARVAAELGEGQAAAGALDVRDAAAFEAALADFVRASGGRLDLLFNNAGIVSAGHFEDIPLARQHEIVDVNLKGVLNGCRLALPHLKATPGARVINMSSASAIYGAPAYAGYAATKCGVKGLTEALSVEWARHGIVVMDVLPLFVNTAMVTDIEPPASLLKLGVRLQPEDVAGTVWRAAHWRWWPRIHWYPGVQGTLLALAHKLMPMWLNRWTTRLVTGY